MSRVREPIQVYLSTAEREKLDRVAKRLGVSRSEVLRRGLEEVAERDEDAALAELIRRGSLRPPLIKGGPIPPGRRVAPLDELLRELDEARSDR
jgi:hypothetical protein